MAFSTVIFPCDVPVVVVSLAWLSTAAPPLAPLSPPPVIVQAGRRFKLDRWTAVRPVTCAQFFVDGVLLFPPRSALVV